SRTCICCWSMGARRAPAFTPPATWPARPRPSRWSSTGSKADCGREVRPISDQAGQADLTRAVRIFAIVAILAAVLLAAPVAADGGNPRTVVIEAGGGATVESPAWSPDGTAIVYTRTSSRDRTQGVEEVDVESGARRLVADVGSSPAYAPDGESIVFSSPVGRP